MAPESNSNSAAKSTPTIRVDCEHTVLPARQCPGGRVNLTASDLYLLKIQSGQKGLVYELPPHNFPSVIKRLQKSLSEVLVPFYPMAGRLATAPSDGATYVDCNDAGASLIEATAEHLTIADVTAPEVTNAVFDLFPLNGAHGVEGHRLPLLAVQVTKLHDGIFVGCSLNHAVFDGASLWHFLNSWAEISAGAERISVHPCHERLASTARLNLDLEAAIERFSPPPLRIRFFHFSRETVKALKDRANRDPQQSQVSSLQALCGHVWQSLTRARRAGPEETTMFVLSIDYRGRVIPPLPSSYCGNAIQNIIAVSTAGELASGDVSSPARLLHRVIREHGDKAVKERIEAWDRNPHMLGLEKEDNSGAHLQNAVILGGSPRFRMYETDFGWGRPVAVRSGCANMVAGKVLAHPGRAGDGSVDLELCLLAEVMEAVENDPQFLNPFLG